MAKEDAVLLATGQSVRNIQATTYINGVATVVEMQVTALSDDRGNIITDFQDYNWQKAMLHELHAIRMLLGAVHGEAHFTEDVSHFSQ